MPVEQNSLKPSFGACAAWWIAPDLGNLGVVCAPTCRQLGGARLAKACHAAMERSRCAMQSHQPPKWRSSPLRQRRVMRIVDCSAGSRRPESIVQCVRRRQRHRHWKCVVQVGTCLRLSTRSPHCLRHLLRRWIYCRCDPNFDWGGSRCETDTAKPPPGGGCPAAHNLATPASKGWMWQLI